MAYTVTFWGTRGSIPTPGAHTARYGGNTPCVAVEGTPAGEGQLVILDAGTGIRALGRELVEDQNGAVRAEILLSHAHWDHIQGLPHFKPFFAPGNAVRIWGSRQGTTSLEAILRQQMDPAVFPVPLDALSAKLTVQQVEPGEFAVGTFRVQRHQGELDQSLGPLPPGRMPQFPWTVMCSFAATWKTPNCDFTSGVSGPY